MRRRGPYKQYEVDASVAVPKSTFYYNRKRRFAEVDVTINAVPEAEVSTSDGDDSNQDPHFNEVQERHADGDYNFQIRSYCEHDHERQRDIEEEESSDSGSNAGDSGSDENSGSDGDSGSDGEDNECHSPGIFRNQEDQRNNPIYEGTTVTSKQCLLLILSFLTRHSLTKEALKDLLLLLNVLLPNTVPATQYKFFKSFEFGSFQIHYYCPSCLFYLGKDETEGNCESCDQRFVTKDLEDNGYYFLYLPIEDQIRDLLCNEKVKNFLTNRDIGSRQSANISDVTSSLLYRELTEQHNFTGNDLSLTWNTDGVQVFKSSQFSIWPIQSSINELPPHLRGKHILLNGLWSGDKKPAMNTFLKPFVDECKQLEENGFVIHHEVEKRKVFAMVLSADSPARAIVRNCKQFNGQHGCDWCEFPGETLDNGGPPTRYYPYRGPPKMRTATRQVKYALKAAQINEPVKGVKGPSVIGILPTFDQVRGIAVDFMHCVCLGVIRQFVNLWMDSKQRDKPFYIGMQEAAINQRLVAIAPPSEITRIPRSISDRSHWKASEWRAFILYSLVVLQGILPQVFLKHLFLFVYGVYSLLGDSIDRKTIDCAEACLTKFVIKVEELYGLKCCSFNVHQLVHLAQSVRNCGPLWSSSAFMFESNNHILHKLFHGTQYVPKQIVKSFIRSRKIALLSKVCIDGETSPAVVNLYQRLTGSKISGNEDMLSDGVYGIGKEKPVLLTASQVLAIEQLLGLVINRRDGFIFSRFVANHQLYSSVSYVRSKKHVNHNVVFEHDQYIYGVVLGLVSIKPECLCNLTELQYCKCQSHNVVLMQPMTESKRSLFKDPDFKAQSYFLAEVKQAGAQVAVHPSQIKRKCISLCSNGKEYFCPLPYQINDT